MDVVRNKYHFVSVLIRPGGRLILQIILSPTFRALKVIPFPVFFQAAFGNAFNLFSPVIFAFLVHLRAVDPCPALAAI